MKFETSIQRRISGRHKACLSVQDFRAKKILDIGCSYGWFEKFTSNKVKEIIGIDLNESDLKIARKECKSKNVKFISGSVLDMKKLKKNYFDAVVMFDVIEHIPKNTEIIVLKQIKDVLKKDGKLIISIPTNNISKFFDPAWYFGHRHYSKSQLKELCEKSGFKIHKMEIKGGFWEIFSMLLFYPYKWILNSEIPFKSIFDRKRDKEYLQKKGFSTIFLIAKKER